MTKGTIQIIATLTTIAIVFAIGYVGSLFPKHQIACGLAMTGVAILDIIFTAIVGMPPRDFPK